MYLASKYEEMYPPALEEFSFITDNTYETKHILRMEQIIMKVSLNFILFCNRKNFLFFIKKNRCLIFLFLDQLVIHLYNII